MNCTRSIKRRLLRSSLQDSRHLADGLETAEDYKLRWRSVRIIYFTMFLMSLGFSIVLTGVWPYLDKLDPTAGKEFMGLIVAANPLAQMLCSPLAGWWGNKASSSRGPWMRSLILFTFASILYSILEVFPDNRKYWMLFSRFLVGVSSSSIAVCRAYVSAATRESERTGAVSVISLAQVLGFIVGPALQSAVTPLGDNNGELGRLGLPGLDMYTACGWINAVLAIFNCLLFLPCIFTERKIAAKEAMVLQGMDNEKQAWKSIKTNHIAAWSLIAAFFVLVFNFVLLETLGTSLTMDQFAWTKSQALYYMGVVMSVGAVVACVTFAAIGPLCKIFEERKVLLWGGFFLMVLGRAVYLPYSNQKLTIMDDEDVYMNSTFLNGTLNAEPVGCPRDQEWCLYTPAMTIEQFLFGYALTAIGYPIGVTLIQAIFSKILGPRPQGVWMGLMTGSGCLSRVLGPVFVSVVYTRLGTIWTFSLTTAMMAVAMIGLAIVKDKLVPPAFEKGEQQDVEKLAEVKNQDKVVESVPLKDTSNINKD
uniref:Putative transporter/transmembrane protein n=1 Tax=Xenopsylla cheopis TaxID=163159 RepID=A0A6M2DTX9_XENCH